MFGNCLNVRVRAGEKALHQGRFDEAFACAVQPEIQALPRGRKLGDDLVRPLLARARLHAQALRLREALDDLDKLAALGRENQDARELRQRVTAEQQERLARRADAHDAQARAKENLREGRLESGRIAIERVDDSVRREQLREELDARLERAGQLLEQARAALGSGDVAAAVRFWDEAVTRHGRTADTDRFAAELAAGVRAGLDACFANGHLARAAAILSASAALRAFDPMLGEFDSLLQTCHKTAAAMRAHDHAALRAGLLRLSAARGQTSWLQAALDAATALSAAYERLLASPLATLPDAGRPAPPADGPRFAGAAVHDETAASPAVRYGAAPLRSEPLLLLVDGTGSSLLVFHDVVRIGRLGGDAAIDLPIPGDLQSHHADVVRDGDDYFLVAHGPTQVNRRTVQRTLLLPGDRIVLGGGAKLTFQKPSGKSETATLHLADRARLPHDVGLVVLFRESCVIGPQLHAHVRTREGQSRLVLFEHDGALRVRLTTADGRPVGPSEALPRRTTREIGDVRLTVIDYRPDSVVRRG